MGIKAKDIAEMVGVSTATVSLVINNKAGVGEKKRQEIIRKIQELGCEYLLKNQQTNKGVIGFVVYKREGSIIDESPFFAYILEGMNLSVARHGYTLSFLYINKGMTREEQEVQLMAGGYKGLIIFAVEMHYQDLQVFKDSQIPFTIMDNSFQENEVDAVAINNIQGTSKAMAYLHEMGHKKIGYIRSNMRINSFIERQAVFIRKLEEYGKEYFEEFVIDVGYSEEYVRNDIKAFLERTKDMPTAFFAENDLIGCSAIRAFQEYGYKIPEDISVIGFDNRPICTLVKPGLTTVHVPKDIFGPAAVELLVSKLEQGREHSLKIEIGTSLIKRESVICLG